MPTEIVIENKRGVQFQEVSVAATESVFWHNEDTKNPHWPVYEGVAMTRTQVGAAPSTNSDSWPIPATPPAAIVYQCSLHPGETGTINVYAALASNNTTIPAAKSGTPYAAQSLTAGGLAPFTWAVAPAVGLPAGQTYGVPPGLSLSQTSAAVVIAGTPSAPGSYLFTLSVTDNAGNNFQQQNYTMSVA